MYELSYADVEHGVSVAIKWQISYNLVMFARIEAHQHERERGRKLSRGIGMTIHAEDAKE